MPQPYLGEIRMFGGNFAPLDWAKCDGQLLPISENDALYSLIGTTYGGDGTSTFALPDLRGRLPVHMGQGPGLSTYIIGQRDGSETVSLVAAQLPAHSHTALAQTADANSADPAGHSWGKVGNESPYAKAPANATMASHTDSAGGGQPHENRMASLAVNFIIALAGLWPNPS